MKRIAKRGLALLMAVLMCMSFLTVVGVHNHAHAADFEYKYSNGTSGYIYNWGKRGVPATELSPNAKAFYTGDYTYEKLSQLTGGTGVSDAPNSELYGALKTLMTSKHAHQTSYQETRDLYQYTDCENNGNPSTISSFYSGLAIGPAWDSGATWNREHTWPNSKGLGGADENDIMMLRPTEKSENGSRGNKAYGESNGYYNPNSVSNGVYDLRGDVARIFLYVYVRWGNVNGNGEYTTWGSTGVMESLDVLLKWMAEDPVDTWELGRNDSVQSITGTRNVFVDYPALANQLFSDPNGGNGSNSGNNPAPTYGVIDTPVAGTAYKFGMIQENKSATDVYYLKGGMAQTYYLDTTTDKDAALDVYLEETTGGYYLYTMLNGTKTYINMVTSGTHVNGAYETNASTVYTYDADSKTVIANVNGADYRFGTRNDKTYTTVGPVNVTYGNFYCKFYGVIGGTPGGDPGSNPGGGEGSDPAPGENVTVTTIIGDYAAANSWADATKYLAVNMDDVVTVTVSGGDNTGKYYNNGKNWRIYQTESPSIVVDAGDKTIVSVKVTYTPNKNGTLTYNGANVASDDVVEVNASSITFGVGNTGSATNGQVRITAIEVVYSSGGSGSNPGGGEGGEGGEGTEPESRTVRIYYPAGNSYVTSVASGTKLKAGNEREAAIWTMTAEGEYYSFSCNGKYLTSGPTGNKLSLSDTLTDCGKWELEETTGGYYIRNVGAAYNGNHNQYLEYYSGFTTYGFKANQYYVFQLKDAVTPDQCTHDWEAATCTEPKTCKICYTTEGEALGHDWAAATCTEPKTCKVCSTTSGSALGHDYEDGSCTVCGEEDPNWNPGGSATTTVTVSIADYAAANGWRDSTKYPTVNMDDVVTVTATGGQNTGKYYTSNTTWRMYYTENPRIVVSGGDKTIVSVKFTYLVSNGGILTYNGRNITSGTTVDVNATSATFGVSRTGTKNGQVRITAIEVVYESGCQHDLADATCTAPKTCKYGCGYTEGEALGHDWADATCLAPKTCQRDDCGLTEGEALGHDYISMVTVQPTCTEPGTRLFTCVNGCNESYIMSVPATGHRMFNGACTACGATTETPDPVAVCGGSVNCPVHDFSDLNADAWYHDGVHFCLEKGLIEGTPDGKFAPQQNITRAELVFALWRLEGSPIADYVIDFADVAEGQWYTEAVRWATSQNLVAGYGNGYFGTDDEITREQFATVMYRYAYYEGRYLNFDGDLTLFADGAQVSDYAIRALQWACGEGLIQGVSSEKLDPQGTATRAQAAAILYRYSAD